jgi:hypothetical protein
MIAPARATASQMANPLPFRAALQPYAATAATGLAMAVADRPGLALRAALLEKKEFVTPQRT